MLADLISQYGYWAVLVGTLLEGETVLLLGGFSAHQGYLAWSVVVLVATLGGALGDFIVFSAGRHFGTQLLQRYPTWQPNVQQVTRFIQRHPASSIIALRFMYGLRLVGPFTVGLSEVPTLKFVFLNLLGALMWATLFTSVGYVFGHAFSVILDEFERYEELLFAVLFVVGLGWGWWRLQHRRKHSLSTGEPEANAGNSR